MRTPASRLRILLAGPILLTLVLTLRAAEIPYLWTEVDRIVAVGDLHGDYEDFIKILKGTGIVDDRLAWAGGKAHLVQTGDILDRGPQAKEILDLLRRLEREAAKAGGMVHVLLGNHEELNITGIAFDYPDYVTVEQFVAFLPRIYRRYREEEFLRSLQAPLTYRREDAAVDADLKVKLREYWLKLMRTAGGQRAYFSGFNDGYGKWLLEKNAVIRINDIVFVHGGISEEYSSRNIETINDLLRKELSFFRGRGKILMLDGKSFEPEIVYDAKGPLWYRDLATLDEGEIRDDFGSILDNLGARSMVIAHTYNHGNGMSPVISPLYMSRFEGRLWTIDTGISLHYGGANSALIIERGNFVLWGESDGGEGASSAPPPSSASALGSSDMEEFLRTAPVGDIFRGAQRGRTEPWTVVLADGVDVRRAIFKYVDRRRPSVLPTSYMYELAAYEVARELGVDIMPPVVEREIGGVKGSLQLLVEGALPETARRARGLEPPDPAAFRDRLETVKIFSLLVDDDCENLEDTLVETGTWIVHRVDFSEAFGFSPEPRPACRPEIVPEGLLAKLKGLDDAKLGARLSPYLTKEAVRALVRRKAALIRLLEGLGGREE
jgi:hypothetical protein